jgi:hypothetical protein
MRATSKALTAVMLVGSLWLATGTAMATEGVQTGTIVIKEDQVMWIVGGEIGGGKLTYEGKTYDIKLDGLKLGGFGAHKMDLDGEVYDLNDLADFDGIYSAAEVGFTVADKGKGDFWLKNDKGVKLRLKNLDSKGLALSIGVEGVDIRLKH